MRAALLFLMGVSILIYLIWRAVLAPKGEDKPSDFLSVLKEDLARFARFIGQFAPYALVGLILGIVLVLVFSINY